MSLSLTPSGPPGPSWHNGKISEFINLPAHPDGIGLPILQLHVFVELQVLEVKSVSSQVLLVWLLQVAPMTGCNPTEAMRGFVRNKSNKKQEQKTKRHHRMGIMENEIKIRNNAIFTKL